MLWLVGCEGGKGSGDSMAESDDDDDAGSTTSFDPQDSEDDPSATTTGGDPDTEEGGSFIVPVDDPELICDVWAQDCPEDGHKCMPFSNDGGLAWNDLKCVPIADNPGQPGDPCTVEGSGLSGVDDCDIGAMCWGVDGETNMGTCVAMCSGDQQAPLCEDPETSCAIVNDGVLTICLPSCDPLLQTCAANEACYPVNGVFTCAPDASGPELGAFGDPCEAINMCDAGLFCAAAAAVPDCQSSAGCCSNFCDLGATDPVDDCAGASEGQDCVPAYDEGEGAPGTEDIGLCAIPST
ncbi:MAG: ribulose phosphate epimerase [Myxococcota bacterium]